MVIVFVASADHLVMRLEPDWVLFVVGGLPIQVALVIGLFRMVRARLRSEKLSPFLTGFEVGGWISHAVFTVVGVVAPQWLDSHLRYVVNMLTALLGAVGFSPIAWLLQAVILVMLYLNGLQLGLALVGGWITQQSTLIGLSTSPHGIRASARTSCSPSDRQFDDGLQ
jgi:hypothetical protein